MKDVKRVPLAERLRALPNDYAYHPLYNVFVNDLCASLGTLDKRFEALYETTLEAYDRRNEGKKDNRFCEYIYRACELPDDARRLIHSKLLIEPFAWLAKRQGGANV